MARYEIQGGTPLNGTVTISGGTVTAQGGGNGAGIGGGNGYCQGSYITITGGTVTANGGGCAAGIVEKTVRAMETTFGSRPQDLIAAIGPCIGQCCFETDAVDVSKSYFNSLFSGQVNT